MMNLRSNSVTSLVLVAMCTQLLAEEAPIATAVENVSKTPLRPQVLEYKSQLYGDHQRFGFAATDFDETPKPLIVDLIPGTYSRVERAAKDCAYMCEVAKENGFSCIAIRPTGRGDGSVYQGFGEVDVYEVLQAVQAVCKIDPQRILLTGVSMGGAATWYHASHHPDIWAAAAPFCGYCDYQLWKKPGGTTFHRSPWEEFSWRSRGAAYRVGILRNLQLRITHGEWDRAVGGGVPVEHSRSMVRKLSEFGIAHEYHELPQTGHSSRTKSNWRETLVWLLKQKRNESPNHISLTVHTLRHNRSHWAAVEQQNRFGAASVVEAVFDRKASLVNVDCQNVRRLLLGPLNGATNVTVRIDKTTLSGIDLTKPVSFVRNSTGTWEIAKLPISQDQKRPGLSGPFGDLFLAPLVIIYGTAGSDEAAHLNRTMAYDQVRFFNRYNGGVHRGGITGDNEVRIPVISDEEYYGILRGEQSPKEVGEGIRVDAELLKRANLYCVGSSQDNRLLAEVESSLPVSITADAITLGGKQYAGKNLAFFAVFPHPVRRRYIALLSGQVPDAICWGSHVGLQLLPDYLVFEHERTVDFGFFDRHWKIQGDRD